MTSSASDDGFGVGVGRHIRATPVPESLTTAMLALGRLSAVAADGSIAPSDRMEAAALLRALVASVARFAHDNGVNVERCVRARHREMCAEHPVPYAPLGMGGLGFEAGAFPTSAAAAAAASAQATATAAGGGAAPATASASASVTATATPVPSPPVTSASTRLTNGSHLSVSSASSQNTSPHGGAALGFPQTLPPATATTAATAAPTASEPTPTIDAAGAAAKAAAAALPALPPLPPAPFGAPPRPVGAGSPRVSVSASGSVSEGSLPTPMESCSMDVSAMSTPGHGPAQAPHRLPATGDASPRGGGAAEAGPVRPPPAAAAVAAAAVAVGHVPAFWGLWILRQAKESG